MSDPLIGSFATSLQHIRETFKQSTLNPVRGILTDRLIEQACRDAGHTWRACLLEPVPTVLSMIAGALWPEDSWQAAASVLWAALRALDPDIQFRMRPAGLPARQTPSGRPADRRPHLRRRPPLRRPAAARAAVRYPKAQRPQDRAPEGDRALRPR